MANTTVYLVTTETGVEQATTMKEVNALLDGKRVTKKAIEAGEVPEVTLAEVMPPTEEFVEAVTKAHEEHTSQEEPVEEDEDTQDSQEEDTEEDAALTDTHEEDNLTEYDEEEVEYPEVGEFDTEKAMKKYIKGLSDSQLLGWCELEGAEFKASEHEAINRMRMAMAIKAIHFPNTKPKASKKSKSKYAKWTTEELVAMALENDVEVPDDKGDMRICRMYTIMALKKAGLLD
jgi:hypothetical protein